MDLFNRKRRRRRLLEGSEVVEQRIRRRLEHLQATLEERQAAIEAQAARQNERAAQLEAKAANLDEKRQNLDTKIEKAERKLQHLAEKEAAANERSAQIKANLEEKRASLEHKIERAELKLSQIEEKEAMSQERIAAKMTRTDEQIAEKTAILEERRAEILKLYDDVRSAAEIGAVRLPNLGSLGGPGFTEQDFVDAFDTRMKEGRPEDAFDCLLAELPMISRSHMNRKEKLNHLLYTTLQLQRAGITKHGWEKLVRKKRQAARAFTDYDVDRNSTFLDFGCGAHDPIALSSCFYLNGFNRSVACDILAARNPTYSSLSMYQTLAHAGLFPELFRLPGTDAKQFDERLATLEADTFADGQWSEALDRLRGKIDHHVTDVVELPVADNELGFVVSFAVLEHLTDLQGVMHWLYAKSKPGAVQFHFIDIADHRSYGNEPDFDPWTFLTEAEPPGWMNRLRKSQHLAAIETAGFEILSVKDAQEEIPAATRERFLEPWAAMTEEDLATTKVTVIFRKN